MDRVPEHTYGGFRRYVEHSLSTGHFGEAVLSNDLHGAFGRADETNRDSMYAICVFVANAMPPWSYGGSEAFRRWLDPEVENFESEEQKQQWLDRMEEWSKRAVSW